ncbi:hypothetical protein [Guggenheimella bovis]
MLEKLKNVFYDVSDFLITLVILLIIVISISFIMNNSLGLNLSKESIFDTLNNKPAPEPATTVSNEPVKIPTTEPVKEQSSEPTLTTEPVRPVQSNEPVAPVVERKKVKISVQDKTTWRMIASALVNNGVIEDGDAFIQEIAHQGLDTKLKPGNFTFEEGMTIQEVIDVMFK